MSWRDNLRDVEPYVAGEQPKLKNLIKLNTNENPYHPGHKVEEVLKTIDVDRLKRYPNPDAENLRSELAKLHGLNDKQVFIGNGSDEVLALTFLTCFNSDKPLLFPDITYSFYPVYCDLYQINYKTIPLQDDFSINKEDYYQENGGIIFPNPNAPTSELMSTKDIEEIIKHNPDSIIVIDEAYIDFGGTSVIPLIEKYENLLVIKTFSKFRSLAGIRLGAAYGNEELISHIYDVKNSFNSYPIDIVAQEIGLASVLDHEVAVSNAQKIMNTRERVSEKLKTLGFTMPESYANFIFIKHNQVPAVEIFNKLREKGIIVRYFNKPKIDNYLRVTIGTDEEMDAFLKEIEVIVR